MLNFKILFQNECISGERNGKDGKWVISLEMEIWRTETNQAGKPETGKLAVHCYHTQ